MSPEAETSHDLDHHVMVETKIIRMANQIATYFDSRPEAERATGIASHINDFWEPRMRTQLLNLLTHRSGVFMPAVVECMPHIRKPAR